MELLLGLTTTEHSNWQDKVREIKELNIPKISLFLTGLNLQKRVELYQQLQNVNVRIPVVHLRHDMTREEINHLQKRFGTHMFNIHPGTYSIEWEGIRNLIYIENAGQRLVDNDLVGFAGLCIDFTHLEDERRTYPNYYNQLIRLSQKYKIGCGHVTAIGENLGDQFDRNPLRYEKHFFEELSEFDYLLRYKSILPNIICIEVENPFEQQLKVIDYIRNLLVSKRSEYHQSSTLD